MMEKDVFGYELPKALPKEELNELFLRYQMGDLDARKIIIEHSIRLVVYTINIHFGSLNYEKEDLVSIGVIGLINAVDTYNLEKNVEFSTYAVKCIDNEIYGLLRDSKKTICTVSLNESFLYNNGNKDLSLEDVLVDEVDFVEQYNEIETYKILNKILDYLPNKEKEIVKLYFGFYDETVYSQQEIADKMGVTRSYISAVLRKTIKRLKILLLREDNVRLVRRK